VYHIEGEARLDLVGCFLWDGQVQDRSFAAAGKKPVTATLRRGRNTSHYEATAEAAEEKGGGSGWGVTHIEETTSQANRAKSWAISQKKGGKDGDLHLGGGGE